MEDEEEGEEEGKKEEEEEEVETDKQKPNWVSSLQDQEMSLHLIPYLFPSHLLFPFR